MDMAVGPPVSMMSAFVMMVVVVMRMAFMMPMSAPLRVIRCTLAQRSRLLRSLARLATRSFMRHNLVNVFFLLDRISVLLDAERIRVLGALGRCEGEIVHPHPRATLPLFISRVRCASACWSRVRDGTRAGSDGIAEIANSDADYTTERTTRPFAAQGRG